METKTQPEPLPQAICSALFVGGANDGLRMVVPDLPIVRLPLPPDQQTSWIGIKTEEYRKKRLATQNRVFEFYVAVGLSKESAIARLLTGSMVMCRNWEELKVPNEPN